MASQGQEITRFSVANKTFFFNEVEASTGSKFLGINTIWGEGNRERLVVFENQYLPFYRAVKESLEHLTGFKIQERLPEIPDVTEECPECGSSGSAQRGVRVREDNSEWVVVCEQCEEEGDPTIIFDVTEYKEARGA